MSISHLTFFAHSNNRKLLTSSLRKEKRKLPLRVKRAFQQLLSEESTPGVTESLLSPKTVTSEPTLTTSTSLASSSQVAAGKLLVSRLNQLQSALTNSLVSSETINSTPSLYTTQTMQQLAQALNQMSKKLRLP